MELDLIDYLIEKNFDDEQIARFQKKYLYKDDKDIIKKLNSIYKIFEYANLTEQEINKLISNNFELLGKSDIYIIKIAFCWYCTGVLSEAANNSRGLNYNNYCRIYLRNKYLNSSLKQNNSPISYSAVTRGDSNFEKEYSGIINGIIFYPNFDNLVNICGKGNTQEEKLEFIEKEINNNALGWYRYCLKKEKEKNNGNRSI